MFTILFTAIGRRVELVNAFKSSFKKHNIKVKMIGVDTNPGMAAAGYFVDDIYKIAKVSETGYVEELLQICRKQQVNMLIPLFEPEFLKIDTYRQQFVDIGTVVVLSNRRVLEICSNKFDTYAFLKDSGVNTPESWLAGNVREEAEFPLFVKPCCGMGSMGAQKVINNAELSSALEYGEDMLIQQYISGTEYTVDVLADFDGQVLSVVPRERLEVRSGEVSKSKTVDRPDLIAQAVGIVEKLGAIGPLTLQCIDTGSKVYWIEINPRFGGGVPLAIHAGVDYPYIIYQLVKGEKVLPFLGQYKKNLVMIRYDQAVYTELA